MKNSRILKIGAFLTLLLVVGFGCRTKQDTIAIIHVRDIANQPVQGAEVTLYATSSINTPAQIDTSIERTATSNSAGEATFNYNDVYQLGQAGVGIFNIEATKDFDEGIGIIKVEQETTSEETVYLQ